MTQCASTRSLFAGFGTVIYHCPWITRTAASRQSA